VSWHELELASTALRGNPLGDATNRPLFVWAPDDRTRRYPTVYVLHSHLRSARSWFNVEPFERTYPDEIASAEPNAVVVLVDGWTAIGGSQWVDSTGIGRYRTYLCEEVVPYVDEHFPTVPEASARGLQGKSSGGYGALATALARPDLFAAAAAHAPDSLFEVTVAQAFPAAARELRDRHRGSFAVFLAGTRTQSAGDVLLAELAGYALAFSDGELPFDPGTAELRPAVWERWLANDPVRLVESSPAALRALRALWLDAGDADDYYLDLGATALARAIERVGAAGGAFRFELFPGRHRGLSWRYPLSLAFLVERLSSTL
jgi:S-formylglutathione hydrolase FrmB